MIKYLSNQDLKGFEGKVCLLRVDLNIGPGEEKNNLRLEAILPTIKLLLKNNIKIVMLSHRGRPKGIDRKFSLKHLSSLISKKIKRPVVFINHFRFKTIKKQIHDSKKQVFLLENLRFLKGELENSSKLARQLAWLGDFYVNDAFSVCHRQNASVVAITRFLPSYAGLLLEKEIKELNGIMKNYRRPLTIIIGGAKISDKIGVIKNFWGSARRRKADYFLLGGGPANTFFAAQGLPVGDSLVDRTSDVVGSPTSQILLPVDVKIHNRQILDIGGRTVLWYSTIIKKSKTIIWNGPMGLFEKKGFEKGTLGIWKAIIVRGQMSNVRCQIVVGGGDTIASLSLLKAKSHKLKANVFLSTGGGAMLAYLAGKKLPGVEALG